MSRYITTSLMEFMRAHAGRDAAVPRWRVRAFLKFSRPRLTDRDFREIYTALPICTSQDGMFLPVSHEEVEEFYAYIRKGWGPIVAAKRRRTVYAFRPELRHPQRQRRLFREGAACIS